MNETKEEINITISGWPGSGTTTVTLLLGLLLKWKCINIGHIFRELGKKLGYSDEGTSRPQFDNYIEPLIGSTIDNFAEYKLLNDQGLILESDIAGFKLGKHPKVFSIFLKSFFDERAKRVTAEGRENAVETLREREQVLKQKYLELWQIDVFDEELINKKFDLVIDNTNMSLENEMQTILNALKAYPQLKENFNWEKINSRIEQEVKKFWNQGKEKFRARLKAEGLYVNPGDMLLEITKIFPEDVLQLSPKLQAIFLGQD